MMSEKILVLMWVVEWMLVLEEKVGSGGIRVERTQSNVGAFPFLQGDLSILVCSALPAVWICISHMWTYSPNNPVKHVEIFTGQSGAHLNT